MYFQWCIINVIVLVFSFREFANKLSLALLSNSNIPLQKLDLSHNPLEDKGEWLLVYWGWCRWWCWCQFYSASIVMVQHMLIICCHWEITVRSWLLWEVWFDMSIVMVHIDDMYMMMVKWFFMPWIVLESFRWEYILCASRTCMYVCMH